MSVAGQQRIVVAGMLAADARQGGATWATLQWVLGLTERGHDVVAIDPVGVRISDGVRAYFEQVVRRFDLQGRAALVAIDGSTCGLEPAEVRRAVERATVLVNLSGRWAIDGLLERVPNRIYVDLDPAFTQLWYLDGVDVGLSGHTHHVTVGNNLARSSHPLAIDIPWWPIMPPVVLSHWPVAQTPHREQLTTIANWRSYGSISRDGVHYGQKAHSFRMLAELPAVSPVPIAVAMSIHDGDATDLDALTGRGWRIVDPVRAAGDPDRYREFIRRSWAELGVAKSGYVVGRTGWVSDRTACYLASGRPAVLHDTGLDDVFDGRCGVVTFDDVPGAADAIARVRADYPAHSRAARTIAEDLLDAHRVLGALIDRVVA